MCSTGVMTCGVWGRTDDQLEKKASRMATRPGRKSTAPDAHASGARAGHERGTAATLRHRLGLDEELFDRRADWLASAADRPNWPRPEDARYPAWKQVLFTDEPLIIHPLSGQEIQLPPSSAEVSADDIEEASLAHSERLIREGDPRRTFLAFWRFGPAIGAWDPGVGRLWGLMPADSRTPDHTIWQQAELVSALHTCLDEGDTPALLSLSFGPVQSFIAQARSTSDLWAGSHLLANIVWAGLQAIVDRLGPDSILFPSLFGSPFADAWLLEEEQLGEAARGFMRKVNRPLVECNDDRNPLFNASLPHRLLALVPARQASELARAATGAARRFVKEEALAGARELFGRAGLAWCETAAQQLEAQLDGFPEVSWSSTEWPHGGADGLALDAAAKQFREALGDIDPALADSGVFAPAAWSVLSREQSVDGFDFWRPGTGLLYAAAYTLNERGLAAAKAARPFRALTQQGLRCTLCGEREWLTTDREELHKPRGQRLAEASPWAALAERAPSLVKPGEFLCAICTAKRAWPGRFAAKVARTTGRTEGRATRFVVSTHALALSTSLARLATAPTRLPEESCAIDRLLSVTEAIADLDAAVLPGQLVRQLQTQPKILRLAHRLPALLERIRSLDDEQAPTGVEGVTAGRVLADMRKAFGSRPETYYALILMDGDKMGAWLSGSIDEYRLRFADTWHPQVRSKVDDLARQLPWLDEYQQALRPLSPARHSTISRAQGNFSTWVARYVIEECVKGRLLYAGGDDVLAMVAVDDLAAAMVLLRCVYSGVAVPDEAGIGYRLSAGSKLQLENGFAELNDRRLIMMGPRATASMGAVIAHHQAPLGRVLRDLREAEARAKAGGRDRFCLRVLKRGGGEVSIESPWWQQRRDESEGTPGPSVIGVLHELGSYLATEKLSRSSLYRANLWLESLPDIPHSQTDEQWRCRAAASIGAQFGRGAGDAGDSMGTLAQRLVDCLCDTMRPQKCRSALADLLAVAEFTARASRSAKTLEMAR